MSGIIHTLKHSLLPRVMHIAALTLAFSADGLANNICETNTSLTNPLAATHSNIKEKNSTVIIQSGIGGTGIHDSGIGGTGIKEDGIGGTGGHAFNNDGIGGTGGHAFNDDGIGGTGGLASNDDGIGGTGGLAFKDDGMGGTGIIGIITGFASICVNGVKIHYDSDTPVTIDGRSSTAKELAVGQMVAIRANGIGNEVTARNIAVIHAVVGPIDSFNPETGKMQVLDQTIQVHDQGRLEYLQTNDWVQVSGHRLSDGTIVASRIELSRPLEQAWINGHVTQVDTTGFIVNGTRIEIDQHVRPEGIIPGAEITASGQWNNESLQVQHVQVDPTDQLIDQVERVVIEGYVQPISSEEFNLGSQTFTLEPDLQVSVNSNDDIGQDQLIQATGTMSASADSIVVNNVEFSAAAATFIPDLETGDLLYGGGDNEGDKDGPAELEKNSNEEIETDENHDNSLDESNQDNLEAESENHPDSDHSLEPIQHESEQESNDTDHLDSLEHGHLEQPEDSHSHNDFIPSAHDSMEIPDGPEEFDTFDGTNDHLDVPIDLDTFDGPNDHDMFDDMHHDWDFDRH